MKNKKTVLLPKYKDLFSEIGENIKLARKRRKLTTEQVSERAGIHRVTLYRLEKGDHSISIGTYFNVCKVFNLHMDFLNIAKDDIFGRKLQDLELLQNEEIQVINNTTKEANKLRSKLYVSLKRKKINEDLKKIIGLDYEELVSYLEDNKYKFKINDKDIDLDHIVPISTATNIDQVRKLNHYTNLQLLPSYYNRNIKSDKKWNPKDFDKWFLEF